MTTALRNRAHRMNAVMVAWARSSRVRLPGVDRAGAKVRTRRCRGLRLIALGCAFASPRALAADSDFEAIRLIYHAPAPCPSVDAFVVEVRRSAPRLRLAGDEDSARMFLVNVQGERAARGRLAVAKDGAIVGVREVEGATCEEVSRVLAFAVALAVDPKAKPPPDRISPRQPSAASPVRPSRIAADTSSALPPTDIPVDAASTLPSSPVPTAPTVQTPPLSLTTPPSADVLSPSPSRAPPSADVPPQRLTTPPSADVPPAWWAVSAHGFAASGLAPNDTFGAGPSVDLGRRVGSLRPAIRLGLDYSSSAPASADGARVTFSNFLLSLEGCPTTWDLGRISFLPCARFDGGARIAAGEGLPNARTVVRPWLDLGAMIHFRIRVGGLSFADLGGGVLFAAIQDRVFLSPDVTVHSVPALGGRGEIALGVAFR
jgi:hypothetical protein